MQSIVIAMTSLFVLRASLIMMPCSVHPLHLAMNPFCVLPKISSILFRSWMISATTAVNILYIQLVSEMGRQFCSILLSPSLYKSTIFAIFHVVGTLRVFQIPANSSCQNLIASFPPSCMMRYPTPSGPLALSFRRDLTIFCSSSSSNSALSDVFIGCPALSFYPQGIS